MKVLVFEVQHTGHRLHFVRLIVEALLDLGQEVTVATSRVATDSEEYTVHLRDVADRITVDASFEYPPGGPRKINSFKLRSLRRAIREHGPAHVYVPCADGLGQSLGIGRLLGRRPFPRGVEAEALTMSGDIAFRQASWSQAIRSRLSRAAMGLAGWTRLHYLDSMAFEAIQRRGGRAARVGHLIPEPIEPIRTYDRLEARRRLGLPPEGRYVGCVGGIDPRKGMDLLIRAFGEAGIDEDVRLLLMGKHDAHIRGMLEGDYAHLVRSGRVITVDRYVTDEEFQLALRSLDLVTTIYPRHAGSSGVLLRAVAARRPVLTSNFGWIAETTRRFDLGWSCNVRDVPALARAIEQGVRGADGFQLKPAAERLLTFHTPENHRDAWMARLRERLGLPAATRHKSWSWVVENI